MQTEHFLNPQGRERSILQLATQAKLFCELPFFETRQARWSRNCHGNLTKFGDGGGGGGGTSGAGNLVKEWYLIQVGVVILLVASCHTNWNKLRRIVGHLA